MLHLIFFYDWKLISFEILSTENVNITGLLNIIYFEILSLENINLMCLLNIHLLFLLKQHCCNNGYLS